MKGANRLPAVGFDTFKITKGDDFVDDSELCRYIKLYHQTIYRVAFSYLHNAAEAEDAVQEAFVKLFNTDKHFTSDEHCKAWLIRVVINHSKNLLRSFRYTHTEELDEAITVENLAECELADALSSLPPKYRVVIHLHYFEGYSTSEIAKILGISATAVTTRLARAREKLRNFMKAEEKPYPNSNALMRRE